MRCLECAAEISAEDQFCVWCRAPVRGQEPEVADSAGASPISYDAGGAVQATTAIGVAEQAPVEHYAPGRGQKVPPPIRRMRRGYSYLGWGAVSGGLALIMVGGYFDSLSNEYDLRYLYAALAFWVCAAVLFSQHIRLSRFLSRPADACSATVTSCQRGGRTLMLYSPWDGYPSGLRVRLAWWAVPEMLLPGESVTFYGRRPAGVGRLLVSSPAQDIAFVGTGRRRLASPAAEQAVQDAPPQPAGRLAGRYLRWGPPALASLAFAAAVLATVIATAPSLTGHLSEGQFRAGDCLTGSSLGLGTGITWPSWVTAVPCTQPHEAEVFFSGNAWPESQAAYPGDNAISNQADARCASAFKAYDGINILDSSFYSYNIIPIPASDWNSGDRQLVCLAYIPDSSTPAGGSPVNYSIRGSAR